MLFLQRRAVELGWQLRRGDGAHHGGQAPRKVPEADGHPGICDRGDDDAGSLSQHHEDDGLPQGRPPVGVPRARRQAETRRVPGLQPLVPPRSPRCVERALVRDAVEGAQLIRLLAAKQDWEHPKKDVESRTGRHDGSQSSMQVLSNTRVHYYTFPSRIKNQQESR